MKSKEASKWDAAKEHQSSERVTLGPYFSFQLKHSPRRIPFILSRYKFAAKMIGEGKKVMEVGCSEGLGTPILSEFSNRYVGLDIDEEAVKDANDNFKTEKAEFICQDFLKAKVDTFDAVVSFDVIEHIYPEHEKDFFDAVCENLQDYGLCIIGTPNITANQYASAHSMEGHVNMYDWKRLKASMEEYFHQVFIFSSNDEMVHTGFYPMAHYLIAMGVCKK